MIRQKYKDTLLIGKKPYAFVFLCIFITCSIGAYTLENIAFINTPNGNFNNNLEFFLLLGVNVVVNFYLLHLLKKYFTFKINIFPLILFLLALIGNVISLVLLPNPFTASLPSAWGGSSVEISFTIDNITKIKYGLLFLLACYYGFMIFSVFPKVIKSSSSFTWLFYVGVFVCLFSIVYSLVTEWDVYVALVTQKDGYIGSAHVSSCYNNRNTFGTLLLLGIACLALIQSKRHSFINYVLMFVLYIELFFALSKTSIIIATVFIAGFFLYRFIIMIKPHPVRTIIGTLLICGVVACFLCFGLLKTFGEDSFFVTMLDNFIHAFNIGDNLTFTARTKIWESIFNLMKDNPLALFFGYGEFSSLNILSSIFSNDPTGSGYFYAHNSVIQLIVSGGLIRLAMGITLIVIFLYKTIKNAVNHNRSAVTFILVFMAFCLHGFSESTFFFPSDTKGMALCFLIMLPCLTDYEKKEIDNNNERVNVKLRFEPSLLSKTSLVISLLLPIFIFIGPFFGNISSIPNQYFPSLGTNFSILCLVSILYLFICLYLFGCLNKTRAIIYNVFAILIMLSCLVSNVLFNNKAMFIASLILEGAMLIFAFIRCQKYTYGHNKKGFFLSLLYLSIFLSLFGLIDFGYLYFPNYMGQSSPSYVTYLSFFNIYLYFIYLSLSSKSMIRPLNMNLLLFEYKLEYFFSKIGNKVESKNEKYYLGKKKKEEFKGF